MLDDLDIKRIRGRMLFDSGGNPAVEAEVILENGAQGRAAVSVFNEMNGEEEADYIREWLSEAILFEDAAEQNYIDRLLTEQRNQDDADHKENGRGKAGVLALSMAVARAAGAGLGLPLYRYLGGTTAPVMPVPMMSMIDGGDWLKGIDFKEIMILPLNRSSFAEGIRMGAEVYQTLKRLLTLSGFDTSVGESGGFAADMKSSEEALHYIMDAVRLSGYDPHTDVTAAICGTASYDFFASTGVEIQLKKAGTVTAALDMIQEVKKMGSKVIVSNSDKETEEAFPGDMAVAAGADYIKCGAPCRGECTAKYNELLRIEEFYRRQW